MKILLCALVASVVAGAVGYYFRSQDHKLKQHGVAQIESLPLSEAQKLIHLAMADHFHLSVKDSIKQAAGKVVGASTNEQYWSALMLQINADMAEMPPNPAYGSIPNQTFLFKGPTAHYLLTLAPAGTYEKIKFGDADTSYSKPLETEKGCWISSGMGFQLHPTGGTPTTWEILCMGPRGFVLKTEPTKAIYWRAHP